MMAPKRKMYDCCFNPFNLEKHVRKPKKNLRPVLPTMLRKLNRTVESISTDMRICDYCRLRIAKMPEIIESSDSSLLNKDSRPSTSAVRSSKYEEKTTPTKKSVDIRTMSESPLGFGKSPINKRKLPQKNYSHEKLEKLTKTLASKALHVEEAIVQGERESKIVDKLKEAFRTADDRNKKIRILTIFADWSFEKIQENFDAPEHMITVAKKTVEEYGILSTPNAKAAKKLNPATENCVVDFYTSDLTSRVMPGEKNYVTVRENGEKIRKQKRLILSNLKETYHLFKETYPHLKVGFSKFCELRPRHCVLPGAGGTHSIRVCGIHENVKLMLDGARIPQLTANTSQPINNYKDCLARMMCNPPSTDCHLKRCPSCPGTEDLINQLEELFEAELIDTVMYKQWVSADRTNLETIRAAVEEFLIKLRALLEGLVTHAFIAQQQSAYFSRRKEQLQPGECLVVGDFSENYAFVIPDAIQGVRWNNDRVTLHPFVAYYNEDNTIKHKNYIAISESLKHDTVAVHLFQRNFVNFLKREIQDVTKIIYFSDGVGAQYKNKKNFLNVCLHQEDFGVAAEWHFFATSHGKGPCNGLGGALKRLAARASLEPLQEPINTPQKFFSWAQNNKNIGNINLEFFTKDDYQREAAALQPRFEKAKLVRGRLTFHCILPLSKNTLLAKRYSDAEKSIEAVISK